MAPSISTLVQNLYSGVTGSCSETVSYSRWIEHNLNDINPDRFVIDHVPACNDYGIHNSARLLDGRIHIEYYKEKLALNTDICNPYIRCFAPNIISQLLSHFFLCCTHGGTILYPYSQRGQMGKCFFLSIQHQLDGTYDQGRREFTQRRPRGASMARTHLRLHRPEKIHPT